MYTQPMQSHSRAASAAIARRNMVVGGISFLAGVLITIVTYAAAADGGTFVVAWGAILFGAIQFFKGLVQLLNR
jgi:VIT1/CCC1 family predicted Fe2+/Mn2+ transporter